MAAEIREVSELLALPVGSIVLGSASEDEVYRKVGTDLWFHSHSGESWTNVGLQPRGPFMMVHYG